MEKCRKVGSMSTDRLGPLAAVVALAVASTALLAAPGRAMAQGWPGYGRDPMHSCLAVGGSQVPQKVRWSTSVDLSLANNTGTIYIHYGTPVITRVNTVIVPVKTTAGGSYQVEAHRATDGQTLWTSAVSDYALPSHDWVPIFGLTLTPKDRSLAYPGAGGTVFLRTFPDSASGLTSRLAFFNPTVNGSTVNYYGMNPAAFNTAIQICTPITSDAVGNLYFGYISSGAALPGYPDGIPSGLARISNTGVGSFVSARQSVFNPATQMVGDPDIDKVAYNCAPALTANGQTVYVAVNNGKTGGGGSNGKGYLCALDSATLAPKSSVLLYDPSYTQTPQLAFVDDDGSATPTVGPDGDVYYGVLGYGISGNHYRGYLLHFDGTLSTPKISSAFGWDDTASIVPASAVPSYVGPSSYLLLTKYNDYADGGGSGINQLAVVDPNATMVDPISGATVMKAVLTVSGVTPDSSFPNVPGAVREWCINSAAIDAVNKCAVVNSEDGHVYRWDFASNQLTPGLYLAPSTSEAYTPTVIGPDGAVYAINDAKLYSCVAK